MFISKTMKGNKKRCRLFTAVEFQDTRIKVKKIWEMSNLV